MTRQVLKRMEKLELEIKEFEMNRSALDNIWKQKCVEIFEVA